jgi:HTH-type transcriptional regulator / antitoxin HigA
MEKAMTETYGFAPDYAVAPGATLKETLEMRGLSQADLAARADMAEKTISQIINGIAPISYETSEKLELVLGVPAAFWNRRELAYREHLARKEATERLEANIDWLKEIPVKALKERGYIPENAQGADLVRLALQFFGVSSQEAWRATWLEPAAQYRGKTAQEKHPGYGATWLRIGELQAESLQVQPFNADQFRRVLDELRTLTRQPASVWRARAVELCAAAGVALVFTKEIPSAAVSGVARWLTKDKAIIQISLKYKSDDQLWFTIFHECGHILLHAKRRVFVDYGYSEDTPEEREANAFARDRLIPPAFKARLPYLRTRPQIQAFAASIGVSAGVVVGRLQFDGLVYQSAFNDLKRKLDWGA